MRKSVAVQILHTIQTEEEHGNNGAGQTQTSRVDKKI